MPFSDDQRHTFEQSQKMQALGTLASGIAHDFNNILQGLYNSLFDLEEFVKDNEMATQRLDITYQFADQAKELVNQILTYSRQQDGDFKSFSPLSAIQDVVEIMKNGYRPQIPIHLEIDTPQVSIYGDEIQIKQIFLNLIKNAFYAMRETRDPLLKIFISTKIMSHHHRRYLCIEIVDNGHGVKKKNQDRIFEPFFTTKNVGESSGLGLSVVHGIIAKHGGTIDMESEPGVYTKFKIHLPTHAKNQTAPFDKNLIYKGQENILLIAPQESVYQNFASILKSIGHDVIMLTNTTEAFHYVKKSKHGKDSVMIIDQTIPHLPFVEFVRKLRQFHPDIPMLSVQGRHPQEKAIDLPESLYVIPVDYAVIQLDKDRLQNFLKSFSLP